MKEIDDMWRWYKSDSNIRLTLITLDVAIEICLETERCEPFQYTKSIFDDDSKRCSFMLNLYKKAFEKYPITMAKALNIVSTLGIKKSKSEDGETNESL